MHSVHLFRCFLISALVFSSYYLFKANPWLIPENIPEIICDVLLDSY
jgi:hypothetical protein